MSTQTKHTPGVMKADGARVVNDSGHMIALLGSDADAERMALAWNCHDELVTACKAVMECCDRDGKVYIPANGETITAFRAAIAKAEGRS